VPGGDPRVDEAVRAMPAIEEFLRQDSRERTSFEEAVRRMGEAIRPPKRAAVLPGGAKAPAAARPARGGR